MKNYARAALALLLLTLALFATHRAYAQDATLTYTPPTTYENGTPLPATDIAGYDAQCVSFTPTGGTAGACPIPAGSVTGNVRTIKLSGTLPDSGGSACFQVRARSTKSTAPGIWSSSVCKTFPAVPPGTPNNITIAVVIGVDHAPAFRVNANGTRGSAVLGFVPVGTVVGAQVYAYRGKPYCRARREDVKWWATTPTDSVAVACTST